MRRPWQATITCEAEPANVQPVAPRQHRRPDGRALEVDHVRHIIARGEGAHLLGVRVRAKARVRVGARVRVRVNPRVSLGLA